MSERRIERLELIEWRDAFHDLVQVERGDWPEDFVVRTVGWIIAEDEKFVHVAAEVLPDDAGVRSTGHIPVAMILHRYPLTEGGEGRGPRERQGRAPVKEARQEDAR